MAILFALPSSLFPQLRRQTWVPFYGDNFANSRRQSGRKCSFSRANLDDDVIRLGIDGGNNAIEDPGIREEMLAEAPSHSAVQDQERAVVRAGRRVRGDFGKHGVDQV